MDNFTSKLQSFKRLIAEDFDSKDRDMIQKVAYSVNTLADDVLSALNNNISIEDNLNLVKKDISISFDSKGVLIGGNNIKTGLNRSCEGIDVIKVVNTTNPTLYPSGTPFISFSEPSTGLININNITNLAASNSYKIRIILF